MNGWTAESVERTLREVSQLRVLALRMGRMPTPRRERWEAEFRSFVRGEATSCSGEALAQGLKLLWEQGRLEELLQVADRYTGPWTLEATTFRELARGRTSDTAAEG